MSAEAPPPELHLILMSRAPVAGETKTRLSPPLKPEEARDFHVACLSDLLEAAADWRSRRARQGNASQLHLFVEPPGSQASFRAAAIRWPDGLHVADQAGETLGRRMERAIVSVLQRAEAGKNPRVVLVGSDLPLLGPEHFDEAAAALEHADVAFGPTPDGGYYLVAVKGSPAGLFELTEWSGAAVLEKSLHAAQGLGLRTALISALPDVDTAADFRAVLAHPLARELSGRRSVRFIEEWMARHAPAPGE